MQHAGSWCVCGISIKATTLVCLHTRQCEICWQVGRQQFVNVSLLGWPAHSDYVSVYIKEKQMQLVCCTKQVNILQCPLDFGAVLMCLVLCILEGSVCACQRVVSVCVAPHVEL